MNWMCKLKPQVLLICTVLGTGMGLGLAWGHIEVATACVAALAAAMTKLVERDG